MVCQSVEKHISLSKFWFFFLDVNLHPYIAGLADESEPVRDAALGAGRVFVEEFSGSAQALDLLLPAIEDGIGSDEWRIRKSSVELLGSMVRRCRLTSA